MIIDNFLLKKEKNLKYNWGENAKPFYSKLPNLIFYVCLNYCTKSTTT